MAHPNLPRLAVLEVDDLPDRPLLDPRLETVGQFLYLRAADLERANGFEFFIGSYTETEGGFGFSRGRLRAATTADLRAWNVSSEAEAIAAFGQA